MHNKAYALAWSTLLILTLLPPLEAKRGGFSIGRSMGRSNNNRGGTFGGANRGRGGVAPPPYQRNPPPPRYGADAGYRPNQQSGINSNSMNRNGGSYGGGYGGGFQNSRGSGGLFGHGMGGGMGRAHRYTSGSGIGSKLRSNTFKNAIVGAAAGYLTYQAGKAIIRAAAGPMMWNNRPYYWGSNYYPRSGHSNVCRMPIEQGDNQFGNVYFQDQTRPREIVWGCGHYEYCCGYECCRGGGSMSHWKPSIGQSIGILLFLLFLFFFFIPMAIKYFRAARNPNTMMN